MSPSIQQNIVNSKRDVDMKTIKTLKEKDTEVADSVKKLINKSMASYYFERIGNTILEIREAVKEPFYRNNMAIYESKLKQLVDAYNVHSVDKVTYQNVVPEELNTIFKNKNFLDLF